MSAQQSFHIGIVQNFREIRSRLARLIHQRGEVLRAPAIGERNRRFGKT